MLMSAPQQETAPEARRCLDCNDPVTADEACCLDCTTAHFNDRDGGRAAARARMRTNGTLVSL